MMRGYKWVLLFMALPLSVAVAAPAANKATDGQRSIYPKLEDVKGTLPSPEEDYQAALKADEAGHMVDAGRLFMRAARRGHAAAQAQVAYALRYAGLDVQALEWFRKAADQGNTFGQMGLATMYSESGVPGIKQDFAEARKWLTLAADQGDKKAISAMVGAYMGGGLGFDEAAKNSPEALAWIKRAVDVDDTYALKVLADAYRTGQLGLAVDLKQADELDAKRKKILGIEDKKKKRERKQITN